MLKDLLPISSAIINTTDITLATISLFRARLFTIGAFFLL